MNAGSPLARLRGILADLPGAVVAYSGGADSAFLADVAHEVLGERMLAVTAVSASLAPRERAAAGALARARGWRFEEVATDEISRPGYRANAGDRCFHCKDTLFETLGVIAAGREAAVLVGTNLDDLGEHRPGLAAAAAHGVRAPLVDAGFDKLAVRAASAERGLPTAEKPATPCLASRVAYGIEVTPERLQRIAQAESLLWDMGFSDLRVRDHGDLARIEVPVDEVPRLVEARTQIEDALRALGFLFVTLDLGGLRSGGMNALLRIGRATTGDDATVG